MPLKPNYKSTGFIATLFERSLKEPEFVAFTLLNNQGEQLERITNINLHKKALLIASEIQNKVLGGGNILLLFNKNSDFIKALFGTFYSGYVAAPFPAPHSFAQDTYIKNLLKAIANTDAKAILTTRNIVTLLENMVLNGFDLGSIKFLIYDEFKTNNKLSEPELEIGKNSGALILHTSGSSDEVKGILHTHDDLIQHSKQIQTGFGLTKDSCSLNLVPLHHYMGLFYGILQPFYSGVSAYVNSETDLAFKPVAWLEAISKYGITYTGGPAFFFEMCVMLTTDFIPENLDLSNWSVAYMGAEPLSREIFKAFGARYSPFGFNSLSMHPCFGMAEIPLISTGSIGDVDRLCRDENKQSLGLPKREYPRHDGLLEVATSGRILDAIEIQIVNIDTHKVCKEGEIGEIYVYKGVAGHAIKNGNNYSSYDRCINNRIYFKTDDIGYKKAELLFVLGKIANKEQANKSKEEPLFFDNKTIVKHRESNEMALVTQHEPIAVIGLAGLFPQSDDCTKFWDNLEKGNNMISEIPKNRWDWKEIDGSPDNQNKKTDIKWGGFINDIEAFDASFFNISPKEAQLMDPMQRKLLQVVWQAVEDAGYRMSYFSGKKIGVFVGIGTFDYLQLILENDLFTHAYASTGLVHCMASNRISYLFNFIGPSESVDTACSSSLVALHRAVGLMRNNECEMAIVCGANILLSSSVYVALSNANMLSRTGQCRTFDDSADGYVRGEGIAAIVLKKMSASIADTDHIYGLIKGIAVNHGGHTNSLTAPNPFAQAEVIKDALKMASFDVDTISYIETHGTATSLGDPIEINGLMLAFNTLTTCPDKMVKPHCALGSVKTNIGHLEATAGLAGVIKVLLSMHYKKIPAHLHLSVQNKNINLDNSPFYFVGDTTAWEPLKDKNGDDIPRRAGISSFGFGGVNSHVAIEEYETPLQSYPLNVDSNVFIFSAKTENALKCSIKRYCDFIEKNSSILNLTNLAYTLQVGREPFDYRLAVISKDVKYLLEKLTGFLSNEMDFLKKNSSSIYYGQVKNGLANIIFNSNDKGINDLEKKYLSSRNLIYLIQLWILGADIKWYELYTINSQVQRISLPTYPFEKIYHWIPQIEKKEFNHVENTLKDTYDVNWYEMPLSNKCEVEVEVEELIYILFCDTQGISQNFHEHLLKNNIQVYKIYYKGASDHTDRRYVIDPEDKANYHKVFDDIKARSKSKTLYIINFWPLDFTTSQTLPSSAELYDSYRFVCQTALNQIQFIVSLQKQLTVHLWIVCANVQKIKNDIINLSCAPLWGMAKTLLLEHPSIFRSIIDLDLNEKIPNDTLFKEINSLSEEGEVVYRKGIRYIPRLVPSIVESSKNIKINPNGVYLITGGLGSLGLLVAEWLSSFKVKKILLLSRQALVPGPKQAVIQEIESRGTVVEIIQADVTNLAKMKFVKNKYIKGNELKGVFHLAGYYQENTLQNMNFDEFELVVSSKIQGIWILNEVFKVCQLDWFVMFSSAASVWGAASGGHYSAANYFLDAYADYCEINNLPAISISWGGMWETSGIIPKNKEEYFKSIGIKTTPVKEGLHQLESIMNSQCRKKVVAPMDWTLFLEVMNMQRKRTLFERLNANSGPGEFESIDNPFISQLYTYTSNNQKRDFILNELKSLLKNILSIAEECDIEKNRGFFDLGMDSLTSIDFRNKLNNVLGIKITTTTLFECNTLQLLSKYLLITYFQENNELEDDIAENKSDLGDVSAFDNIEKNELLKFLESEIEIH
ncbi:MAG: KR domain-containing protein [Legionella sp.]|nr:KR domain-containing protein [Legionella sp.]